MSEEFFFLFERCLESRREFISKNKLEAWRLYSFEEAMLPAAIDIYKDDAVIHLFDDMAWVEHEFIESALKKLLSIQNFFYKNRTKRPIHLPERSTRSFVLSENDHKFLVNLSDYLDTGLFLDHRESRQWIQNLSKNKIVLNLFAYTGSFSVYAAAGEALKTYSVDLSKTYCDWMRKNMDLNGFPPEQHWIYKMDSFEFLRYAKRKNLSFDIIIIDPPTFSRNKGATFHVQKDHVNLLQQANEVLAPDGFVLFSNNFQDFRLHEKELNNFQITEKLDSIPLDFSFGPIPHRCWVLHKIS